MASRVSMANAALTKIGGNAILSLTEETEEGRQCNSRFDDVLDNLLQSHPWNFAQHQATLTPLSTTPDHRWEYQFLLPTNPYCLKVVEVYHDPEFKVYGRNLMCNDSTVSILYTRRITDVNDLSPMFRELFALKLGSELAYPIAGSTAKGESLLAEFATTLRVARSVDAQEGVPDSLNTGSWYNERGQRSSRYVVARR